MEDAFTRKLEDLLEKYLETSITLSDKWRFSWLGDNKRVCRIDTLPQSEGAVWTKKDGKTKIYYLRKTGKTTEIDSGVELEKELRKFSQNNY